MSDATGPNRDPLSDDALAGAYRATRKPSGDHLTPDQWERLACDELRGPDRERALAHIESCGECTAIHRGLLELREGATEIENRSPRDNAGLAYRRWSIAGGLATAAAIVFAVLINQPARVDPNDAMRSGLEKPIVTLIPSAQLGPSRTLAWQPLEGADRYELRVTTTDGKPVFTSRRDQTSARIPLEIALQGEYFWRVIALKGDATIATSPISQFSVGATLR